MIKLDLYKVGMWGTGISALILCLAMISVMFLPSNEQAIVYLIYIGMVAVVAKTSFIVSFIMMFIGLVVDRARNEKT